MKYNITKKSLMQQVVYSPETGEIYNLQGKKVGSSKGRPYPTVWLKDLNGKRFRLDAHRIAFLYIYGYIPDYIDHKDLNGMNNKIENLRVATHRQNMMNVMPRKNNKSGYKGVSLFRSRSKWNARIVAVEKGIKKYKKLGYFETAEEAASAYNIEARKQFGQYAYFNLNKEGNIL